MRSISGRMIVIRVQQTLCNFYKPLFSGHPLLSGQLRGPEGVRLIEVSPYLKTARTEISPCKPNKKLFRLPGSSYFHVNSPLATASFLFPTKQYFITLMMKIFLSLRAGVFYFLGCLRNKEIYETSVRRLNIYVITLLFFSLIASSERPRQEAWTGTK